MPAIDDGLGRSLKMRIQIEIDAVGMGVLEDVKQRTGLTTYKDIFNNGVTLLQWAIKQRVEGRVIASLDENTTNYKELTMPVLEEAARRSRVPV
jgi:hypothetical protein